MDPALLGLSLVLFSALILLCIRFYPETWWPLASRVSANDLHFAAERGQVKELTLLLDKYKMDPNALIEGNKATALHRATLQGHLQAVIPLLTAGANPNARDDHGLTPLLLAAWKGHISIIKELLALPHLDIHGIDGETVLHVAAQHDQVAVMDVLLTDSRIDSRACTKEGLAPLHVAILSNALNAAEFLSALPHAPLLTPLDQVHGFTALDLAETCKEKKKMKKILAGALGE